MKANELLPPPKSKESFQRNQTRFISRGSGCYLLTTFEEDVLYIGLTVDLRRRFGEHLDNAEKTKATKLGRAVWFFWLECTELETVERSWMNSHVLKHAQLPILNKVFSPISM